VRGAPPGLALDEPIESEDPVMIDGIPVRVDSPAAMYAAHSIVDYVDSLWGKGLTIRPSSGGC